MDIKNFVSGEYRQEYQYKSFIPSKINKTFVWDDPQINTMLEDATRALGELNAFTLIVPNIDIFIQMHITKEANSSSKIEGTKTNIEEALLDKDNVNEEKRDDWEEVNNYILALNSAIENLERLPFSSRLIKETHKTLLQGVRGKHKLPGEFRSSQNWIGGASIKDATFIPPTFDTVNEFMSDIEKFAHSEEYYFPDLLKIALIHYQFETIHPFLDGNGRVGRLMITLYLVEKGILKKPVLYLSDFFERNRTLYYDNLTGVREKDNIIQWFKFFLVGIIETSKNGVKTFDGILKLQKEVEEKIKSLGSRSNNARLVINYLFQRPVIEAQSVQKITGLSLPSVYKLIKELEDMEILKEVTGGKRGKLYVFNEYLKLFK